jgi:hypothetical protein
MHLELTAVSYHPRLLDPNLQQRTERAFVTVNRYQSHKYSSDIQLGFRHHVPHSIIGFVRYGPPAQIWIQSRVVKRRHQRTFIGGLPLSMAMCPGGA